MHRDSAVCSWVLLSRATCRWNPGPQIPSAVLGVPTPYMPWGGLSLLTRLHGCPGLVSTTVSAVVGPVPTAVLVTLVDTTLVHCSWPQEPQAAGYSGDRAGESIAPLGGPS